MKFYLTTDEIDERPVYITGTFNQWDPRDETFVMKLQEDGTYFLEIPDKQLRGKIQYKYTKGGWESV